MIIFSDRLVKLRFLKNLDLGIFNNLIDAEFGVIRRTENFKSDTILFGHYYNEKSFGVFANKNYIFDLKLPNCFYIKNLKEDEVVLFRLMEA